MNLPSLLKVAVIKDGCGTGEVTVGNWQLHMGILGAVLMEDVDSFMKQPGNETACKEGG